MKELSVTAFNFFFQISYNRHIKNYHESPQPVPTKQPGPPKPKKKRKDAGIPKQVAAEVLSGVSVDKDTQIQLIKKEDVDIDEELLQHTLEACSDNYFENYSKTNDESSSGTNVGLGETSVETAEIHSVNISNNNSDSEKLAGMIIEQAEINPSNQLSEEESDSNDVVSSLPCSSDDGIKPIGQEELDNSTDMAY